MAPAHQLCFRLLHLVLLLLTVTLAAQAQRRALTPLSENPETPPAWQEYARSGSLSWTPAGVPPQTAVRGVEWIEQDRGAVFFQPNEYIRLRVKWSSTTPILDMRVWISTDLYRKLFDDGTHGDKAAGDGIWTNDSLTVYTPGFASVYRGTYSHYKIAAHLSFQIQWQLTDGTWENDGYAYLRMGLVDPMATMDVRKLGNGIWATEYALFIEDSLQSTRTFTGYPVTSQSFASNMKPASNVLYSVLPDAFDFLLVIPGTPIWLPNPVLMERVPNATTVRNDIQGIGLPMYNYTADWGSGGKLQAVVYHSYGPFNILAHELGHRWTAYLDSLTFSNGACGVHWAEDQTIGGNMSLWPKVIETAPGVFKGIVHDMPDAYNSCFSDLDLYLMGLKPLADVPTIKRLRNADYSNPDTVRYSSVTVTDPLTLPTRYGQRVPAYPSAQHDFTMATIVVKPLGWTDAEFTYFSTLSRHAADTLDDVTGWNYNFEKSAKFLATLESKMYTPAGMPAVPVLKSPPDSATAQPTSITFRWDSSQGAKSYNIEVSPRSEFTDSLIEKSGLAKTSVTSTGLLPRQKYYWRVRALGPTGISRFSSPRSFETGTAVSVEMSDDNIPGTFALLQNYPNPFNPKTVVSCQLPVAGVVRLVVYDVLGREVKILMDEKKEAGRYDVTWDASGCASGVYVCRMTAGAFVDTKKMVVVR